MKIKLSNIFSKNYNFSPFFIIILFISQLKLNFATSLQQCLLYNKCLLCKMCSKETNTECDCKWDPINKSCSKPIAYNLQLDKWYYELSECDEDNENKNSNYCPSQKYYTTDDLENNKIIININKDQNGKYGKDFIYCLFEYVDELENNYDINISYSSKIISTLKPKIILTNYTKENNKISDSTVEISDNYEHSFNKLYKLTYLVLLKAQYNTMPVSFILTKTSNAQGSIIPPIILSIFLLGVIFFVIFCSSKYSNKRKRKRLIRLRAQRNLEYIEPSQINSEVDQEVLIRENTEKLNYLFVTKLAEHIYKKEYNQYGGGCSICLENFNKKSKVSITSCNHVFHYKCIYEWLFKNILCPKCPNCNNEILKDNENNSENIINQNIINQNNDNGESSYE